MTSRSEPSIREILRQVQVGVDGALDTLLPSPDERPHRLHEAMRYSVFAGGKRIRPALLVLTAEAFGAGRDELLPAASALELIHTYSLIHDDLPALDNDDLRRGKPTLHRRYGEATAILAGDALLTLGLGVLAREPADRGPTVRLRALQAVGAAIGTRGMIGGQMADLETSDRWPESAATELEWIHRRKTGALIRVAVFLGGLYADASDAELNRLGRLGELIGLSFQIADDMLDVEGSVGNLGKSVGKDAEARKLTYPGLFGLEESRKLLERAREEALAVAGELPKRGGALSPLIDFVCVRDH